MRPKKCDQEKVNRTLRSDVRGKNEGIFGLFECDIFLTWLYFTLNYSKSKLFGDLETVLSYLASFDGQKSIKLRFKLSSFLALHP